VLRGCLGMSKRTRGTDLMNEINQGRRKEGVPEEIEKIRDKILLECEELLCVGARIRPLFKDDVQIGWVRGIYSSEMVVLKKWIYDTSEFLIQVMLLSTTLTREEIKSLTMLDMHSIMRIIYRMKEYDISLYPYLSAFSTTSNSERIWFTQEPILAKRKIKLPDGKKIRLLTNSDHLRLWITLCTYRAQAKQRLEASLNALMIVRPWAGKSADPIAADLKNLSRNLSLDTIDSWRQVVNTITPTSEDGWAHAADSVEGLYKELLGMMNNDRHEQVIHQLEIQQKQKAEQERIQQAAMLEKRLKELDEEPARGFLVRTEQEVRELEKTLRRGVVPADN
jgi:hypothetical protein